MPYYGVKNGFRPGVYEDWSSCQEQVKGFKSAKFKKFDCKKDAEEFVSGTTAPPNIKKEPVNTWGETGASKPFSSPGGYTATGSRTRSSSIPTPPQAAAKENRPDVASTQESVGMLKATVRALRSTAEQLLKGIDDVSSQVDHLSGSLHTFAQGSAAWSPPQEPLNAREHLKRTYSDFSPLGRGNAQGNRPDPEDAEPAKKYKKQKLHRSGTTECCFTGEPFPDSEGIQVYTDGASTDNGFATAKAGIGVYWGERDPNNLSQRLQGRQTNNRAEIHAAVRAVQQAKRRGIDNLIINTDSMFLINGITAWIFKWKKNGWKLSTGADVINKDDFEKLDQELQGISVKWVHVRGHSGNPGNEMADKLAVKGAGKPLI